MLVEMMAAIARKDYDQRRERQAQGIEKAKAAGKYQGHPIDSDLHRRVIELLGASLGIRAQLGAPTALQRPCYEFEI
jgi:DNA invertase Pin-like site-specific DNA recombinase